MASITDEVLAIFAAKGQSAYFGENVSQLEHALQAAQCALESHAGKALVTAALVHDIGHLLEDISEDVADEGLDAKHEEIGQRWLAARVPKSVYEPVHLHVDAKRYLCATDPAYFGKLSAASVQSLGLQGGPMTAQEVAEFETNEFFREAVALRRWDDEAKIPGLPTKTLEEFRLILDEISKRL